MLDMFQRLTWILDTLRYVISLALAFWHSWIVWKGNFYNETCHMFQSFPNLWRQNGLCVGGDAVGEGRRSASGSVPRLWCCPGIRGWNGLTKAFPGQPDGTMSDGGLEECSLGYSLVHPQLPRIGKQLQKILKELELWPILFGGNWGKWLAYFSLLLLP